MKAVFNILLAVVLFAQNLGPIYASQNGSPNTPGQENIFQALDGLNQIIETPVPEETQFPTSTNEPTVTNIPEESATPTPEETSLPAETPTPQETAQPASEEPTATPTEVEAFEPQEPAQSLDCLRDIVIETPRLESEFLDFTEEAEMPDAEIAQIEPQPDAEVIVCPSGANISAREGKLKISFPENKAQKMLRVKIGRPAAEAAEYFLSDDAVEISAYSLDEGKAVRQFTKELSIEFTYDPEAYAGVEEALNIFYYDETQRTWISMPTRVDKQNHTLRARSNHLTVFDYDIDGDLKIQLPNLDQNTLSQYTGAATYSLPINVPAGPGGLTPNLSLQYSSQVIDELPIRMQGSWVGMGWDLNTPSLERNRRGTYTLDDDSWTLNFYGSSQTLFLAEDNYYHALDENFQRGSFYGGNFYLRDKDGSVYTFASKLNETQLDDDSCDRVTFPWRYLLTKITDRFGNSLTFTYTTYSKTRRLECGQYYNVTVHTGAALSSIQYDQSPYRINFVTETRTDYDTNWETSVANSAKFSKVRLNEIQVVYNTQIIKRYQFFYSGSPTDPTPGADEDIYPEYQWSKGGKTLTLIGLQEIGRDGGALPRYRFSYADNMHLTKVENGYGGSVEYTYTETPWYDTTTTASRTTKETLSGIDCDDPENTIVTNWYREGTATRSCYNGWLRVSNGWAYRGVTNTGALVKPGGMYKIVVALQTSAQIDIQLGVRGLALDGTPRYASGPLESRAAKGEVSAYIQLGADMKNVLYKRLYCSPACAISKYELYQLPTHYQVKSRTIKATPFDAGSTFEYSYDDMASNDEAHSWQASLASPGVRAYEEYRGNAIARVLAPGNGVTSAYFYQDDYRQGRTYLNLSGQEQYYEPFEDSATVSSAWSATPGALALERSGGDPALKLEANAATRVTSLSPGQAIVFQFKPEWTGGEFEGEFSLAGEGTAITLSVQENGWSEDGNSLPMPPITSGEWYTAMLVIGEEEVAVKVWNRSAPDSTVNQAPETPTTTQSYSACSSGAGSGNAFYQASFPISVSGARQLTFTASGSTGVLWLDGYQELRLYQVQETPHIVTYKKPTVRPTNAAGLFFGFTRMVEQRSYTFEGTAVWIGTRATLSYDCPHTGTEEYGNLTWTEEYAAAYTERSSLGGLAWQPKKGVETRYQPRVTSPTANPVKYLAAFPAQVDTYACETEPCEKSAEDLLSRSVYLYDNAATPQTAPTQGCLTGLRTLLNPGEYADIQYACDIHGNVTSEKRYVTPSTESSLFSGAALETTRAWDGETHTRLTAETLVFTRNGQDASLVTQIAYDAALGLPVSETDPNGNVTTAGYDQFGRILTLRKPGDEQGDPSLSVAYTLATDGSQVTGLNVSARQRVAQNADGSYLSYEVAKTYNGLGQLTRQRVVGAVVGASPQTITVEYVYDDLGRLVAQSMPYAPGASPAYTQTGYDALGRPLSVTATDGTSTSIGYDIQDGQFVTTTLTPKLAETKSYADAWGRVLAVEPKIGPGVNYAYDAADRLVGAQYGDAQTEITYDLAGRKTGLDDADMGLWTYAYNALGSLTGQTDAAGCTTEMSYDGLGRLAGKSFDSVCPATAEVTYAYDGVQYLSRTQTTQLAGQKGYRSGMLDGTGYTNWTYDARGRVVSEQKTIGTRAFASDWTYNSADLVASLTYPADETGQREVVHYSYLPQKQLSSLVGEAAYVEAAQYDAAGRLTQRALGARDAAGEPLLTQYQYAGWGPDANPNDAYSDGQGRLLRITSGAENTPGLLQDLSYRYDIAGNITQITDANLGPQMQSFGYDALDRILSASAVGGSVGQYAESYTYDSEGRLASKNGVIYTYNPEEYPFHAVVSLTDGKSYGYDANGSMVQRVIGADTFTLLYDGSLRMVAVQKNGATIAEFAYDGDGQMVTASVGGVVTSYVGGYFEWQTDASGSAAVKYYSAGSARVAMRKEGVVTYLFGDHLDSTSVTFDDVTNDSQSQGYTAFGEQRYFVSENALPFSTDYQYTGQKDFEAIGLQFYNARWYDSALGRFTQADSIIPQPGNPMAWDRFAYALNAPTMYTDPTGHAYCSSSTPGAMCVNDEPDSANITDSVAEVPGTRSSVPSSNPTAILSNGIPETAPSVDPSKTPPSEPPTGTGLPDDGWEWNDNWTGLGRGWKNKYDPEGRVYRPDKGYGKETEGEEPHWHVKKRGSPETQFPGDYRYGRRNQRKTQGAFNPATGRYEVVIVAYGLAVYSLLMSFGGGDYVRSAFR